MAKRESSNWPDGHTTGRTSCGNQDGKKISVSLIGSISMKVLDFAGTSPAKLPDLCAQLFFQIA